MQINPRTEPKEPLNRPATHGLLPALAIGALSVVLAAGLAGFGILGRINTALGNALTHGQTDGFPKSLAGWQIWLATAAFAFGLAFAILHVPGTWRRVMLWLTAVVVTSAWAPVLVLAARAPEIGAPWIATVWSGVCALVYAANHRMACDWAAERAARNSPADPHEAR